MKKIVALLLSALMLVSCLSVYTAAAENTSYVEGVVPYSDMPFYYFDTYFNIDASTYDPSLSAMSLCLAVSGTAMESNGWENQSVKAREMLTKIGFTDVAVNADNKLKPDTDTMGVTVAKKDIGDTTVIAVVPRSLNYGSEWANNFTIGKSGEAEGFSNSAAKVEAFLAEYANSHSMKTTVKLWIVGYSRGAAVANLVAGHITRDGKVGNISVEKKNIFGYTFGTPRAVNTADVSLETARSYTNIHNIAAANDLVTKVAPEKWSFIRFGTDEDIIPVVRNESNTALFDKMVALLPSNLKTTDASGKTVAMSETFKAKKLPSDLSFLANLGEWEEVDGKNEFVPSNDSMSVESLFVDSDKTMAATLDDLFTALSSGIGSRTAYTQVLQDTVRTVVVEIEKGNFDTEAFSKAKTLLGEKLKENGLSLIMSAVSGFDDDLKEQVRQILNEVIEESGLDSKAYGAIADKIAEAIPILVKAISADLVLSGGADIISVIMNFDIISCPHYYQQYFAWLRVFDSNYGDGSDNSIVDVRVSDLDVRVDTKVESKKVLLWKVNRKYYEVKINPVTACGEVAGIEYRLSRILRYKKGDSFTSDLPVDFIQIRVTDKNGNVTEWLYQNGKVTKSK